ncbi:tetratricopeptide repeat protein [Streptomyces sp. NPDC059781]|uniref:tetratricopeptide repeat protein n=1 Tax=Streptomyces sp. NPDC059781 TaxID=3346943 RepID=UPI0036625443
MCKQSDTTLYEEIHPTGHQMFWHDAALQKITAESRRRVQLAPFTRPVLPAGPLNDLLVDLHELHLLAGYPSSRTMEAAISSSSHTRIHKLFVEPRRPDWGLLELVVEYLAGRAHRDETSTRQHFYDRWVAVARASSLGAGDPMLSGPALSPSTVTSTSAGEGVAALPRPKASKEEEREEPQPAENLEPQELSPIPLSDTGYDPLWTEEALLSRAKKAPPGEAEEIYQRLIARGSAMGRMIYGTWHAKRGNLEEAERHLRVAGEMRVSQALVSLGKVLERSGRFAEAVASYEESMQRGEVNAAVVLGKLHEKRMNYLEAERAYLTALERGEKAVHVPLARLYEKMGKPEQAEQMYLSAIQYAEGSAVIPLARFYARRGDFGRQEQVYEDYIKSPAVTPCDVPVFLGEIRERQGRLKEALELYRMALTLGSTVAPEEIERLERAVEQSRDASDSESADT